MKDTQITRIVYGDNHAFKEGIKVGKQEIIDKVCEWLSTHSEDVTCKSVGLYGCKAVISEDLINNLRKAMED